ncbi:MAG TPA: glycine betaine ABC transporter substrate-binding protein, partial [Urbifossiella sp.]|nr:glycine betaine ABC transporter substrate-binding protein [Urbifossiella sp.]
MHLGKRDTRRPARSGPSGTSLLLGAGYLVLGAVLLFIPGCAKVKPVVIGSKKFTESIILAKMGVQLARAGGADARHDDLGGTPALWLALTQGDIDAYVEYTGTISREIFKEPPDLDAALAEHGVRRSKSLGFRNNYA